MTLTWLKGLTTTRTVNAPGLFATSDTTKELIGIFPRVLVKLTFEETNPEQAEQTDVPSRSSERRLCEGGRDKPGSYLQLFGICRKP